MLLLPLALVAGIVLAGKPVQEDKPGVVVIPPAMSTPPERAFGFLPMETLLTEPQYVGESDNGFPNWQERVMHEWINRARVDPQVDLAGCGSNCPENIGSCYVARSPLIWNGAAARAARFHSSEMGQRNFFCHNSNCSLVSNINSLYPDSCVGEASCACVGGVVSNCTTGTSVSTRLTRFGVSFSSYGEIIAGGQSSADEAFYDWLLEYSSSSACAPYSNNNPPYDTNGHRWLILQATNAVGTGYESVAGSTYTQYYTADFAGTNSPIPKIPSGTHYPQQAASIDFWVNWYDAAAPQSAAVNVDGSCTTMDLTRGTSINGAYKATLSGLGTGCHRYYFTFRDSGGTEVTYPTTGSFGIGTSSCPDWDATRPAACSTPTPGRGFYTVTPCRLFDTRGADGPTGGPAIQPSGTTDRSFTLAGACGVPSDAVAISANITAVEAGAMGELTLFAADQSFPGTWTISFPPTRARANNAIVQLSPAGAVKVRNSSTDTVHLVIDVNGYFK